MFVKKLKHDDEEAPVKLKSLVITGATLLHLHIMKLSWDLNAIILYQRQSDCVDNSTIHHLLSIVFRCQEDKQLRLFRIMTKLMEGRSHISIYKVKKVTLLTFSL